MTEDSKPSASKRERRTSWGALLALVVATGIVVWFVYRARLERRGVPEQPLTPTVERAKPEEAAPVPKKVFNSPLAGQWYPANRNELEREIAGFLEHVDEKPLAGVQALILPHAGYPYSGQTACYGVKQVAGAKFSRVIVMGPSHRVFLENAASVPDVTHYATPLGEVPLDVMFIAALKRHPLFTTVPRVDEVEHSVQIEVPLLQYALGEFQLVPITVGQLDVDTARSMAQVLLELMDARTLVVVSSDFTHYGPNYGYVPFSDDIPENLRKLDMGAYEAIDKKDLAGFFGYLKKTGATVCGESPIGVLLAMLPAQSEAHLLHYDTSGNITGDYRNSVSYLSIAFTGAWQKGEAVAMTGTAGTLSAEDKAQLLKLARETLTYVLKKEEIPRPDQTPSLEQLGIAITPGMKSVMGAFVTLTERGSLRGCIGEIEPRRPVYQAVMAQTINAAFHDPRFPPVAAWELPDLHFEISAYAAGPKRVGSFRDIVLGRDGIVLEKQGRRALFLPQVAPEQGWDLEETLNHLALKAGLPQDAWKEGASFSVFEAIVFGEAKG